MNSERLDVELPQEYGRIIQAIETWLDPEADPIKNAIGTLAGQYLISCVRDISGREVSAPKEVIRRARELLLKVINDSRQDLSDLPLSGDNRIVEISKVKAAQEALNGNPVTAETWFPSMFSERRTVLALAHLAKAASSDAIPIHSIWAGYEDGWCNFITKQQPFPWHVYQHEHIGVSIRRDAVRPAAADHFRAGLVLLAQEVFALTQR